MKAMFRRLTDQTLGRGDSAITVPVMDGPLRPNRVFDEAPVIFCAPAVDNLTKADEGFYCTSGPSLYKISGSGNSVQAEVLERFASDLSCLAADGKGGLAIGLDGSGVLIRGGAHHGLHVANELQCPTACLFLDPDTLLVTNGSAENTSRRWKHDLMGVGRSGSVWRFDLSTQKRTCLLTDLGFPYGLAQFSRSTILISEAWRHRVILLDLARPLFSEVMLGDLPGYPSRIAAAEEGGYWLSIFAARTQLVEFVLRERRYRERMIREIDPEFWVAPALSSGLSFLEPLQGGGVKQMGILKPWAPPRSYGLVVKCDASFLMQYSFHSRSDGSRHGITSVCESGGELLVSARGAGSIMRISSDRLASVGARQ